MSTKLTKAVLAGLSAAATCCAALSGAAPAQAVIGNWEDPGDLMDGWIDWQGRGVYSQSTTFGVTNGSRSLKLLTADDGGNRWMQSLAIRIHERGFIDEFLASGKLAIDVSWKHSEWVGGNWAQVENLSINSGNTGFTDLGRATDDTSNDPPWNGSWDTTNFGDDTRTLTWDMTHLVDGNLANGEVTTVPAAENGGYLELIFATNYDSAFDPTTAAFYFDNARLLPRVVTSEWTGAGVDPDNNAGNGNAATGNWFSSTNWTSGVPGVADAGAVFATNGGALVGPQTVNTDHDVTVGSITFDNAAGYTIGGAGTLTLDVSAGQATVNVVSGSHTIAVPVTLADNTTVTVAPAASTLNLTGGLNASTRALTKAGAGKLAVTNVRAGGLTINAGTVTVAANGTPAGASHVSALALAGGTTPTATLDLNDNDLVVTGGSVPTIAAQVAAARNSGAWNRPGITSSAARAHPQQATTLGVLGGADYISVNGTNFDGFTVVASDTLVKYTWYGDSDFSGVVDFDDYVRIDNGFNTGLSGWFNGDFDFSGVIDFDDYVLIDLGFNTQTGTLRAAVNWLSGDDRSFDMRSTPGTQKVLEHYNEFGLGYAQGFLAAVPEPASLAAVGVAALAAMSRGRKRRSR